ncbi:esterase/lipase family protein [Prosthecobacter sp.]|jgi:pimeloyl-ACP methyl ester carboxylesterase|uniref:esterase/lipase family protein n=1 Tax=Prosthecobacter sp. TaxID=1965333 RepID=UPI0037C80D3A
MKRMLSFVIVIASVFNLAACQGMQSASLEEAHEAWLVMQHEKPGTATAQTALLKYDHAVAQVMQCLRSREGTAAWGKEMQTGGVRGWRLTFDAPETSGSTRTLALAEFAHCRPAAEVRLHGFDRVVEHGGLGVPVVLAQDDPRIAQKPFHPPNGECLPATAVLEFPPDVPGHAAEARLRFYNPLAVSEIAVGRYSHPLAENLTAALQGTLTDLRVDEKGAGEEVKSASGEHASRLFFLSRYDKGRVPVVFVHGMLAGPDVWKNCVNEMYADAGLRRRFQPVCFIYPSKLPIPASAARLRELLTQARGRFDAGQENAGFGRMVLVGHSMGGLLARMQVIDSGEDFWRAFFDVSPERLEGAVDADTRHMLQQSFFFKRRSDIGTVVFISTPHQGSVLADNRVLRTLVRTALFLPKTAGERVKALMALPASFIHPESRDFHAWGVGGVENLAAKHPFARALARHPVEVPFHSIIATRRTVDGRDSSDGIVPYWSAHLDGAASETIVPYSHRCTEKPETVRAVMKILAGVR